MERLKQEIWRNPERYHRALDELVYTTGLNPKDAVKSLIGAIDDLTKIYTGEKTPRRVGIERDATQIIHLIKDLQDKGSYTDTHEIADKIANIIESHIQDSLLKKAYKEAIMHYTQTHHQPPRDERYLDAVIEKERELEEKLRNVEHEGRKLTDIEVRRIGNLYRILMLLTPHPTLEETKRFYGRIAHRLKIRVGSEEFLPTHGPVTEDMATSFAAIRKAPPHEKEEIVKREIARFEPLLSTAPHIKEKVLSILATTHGPEVPMEKHNSFIRHLERTQIRRPIE